MWSGAHYCSFFCRCWWWVRMQTAGSSCWAATMAPLPVVSLHSRRLSRHVLRLHSMTAAAADCQSPPQCSSPRAMNWASFAYNFVADPSGGLLLGTTVRRCSRDPSCIA